MLTNTSICTLYMPTNLQFVDVLAKHLSNSTFQTIIGNFKHIEITRHFIKEKVDSDLICTL